MENIPFIIADTDSSEKSRTHWWSMFDIEPRSDIFLKFFWT